MYEKVNPAHPDKCCDRIAGAIVDLAYEMEDSPRIAVEVMLGHGACFIVTETSVEIPTDEIDAIVCRIAGEDIEIFYLESPQDAHLSANQKGEIKCGDNGIFKGVPLTGEQVILSQIARSIYEEYPYDGKYILDGDRLIICQSNADSAALEAEYEGAEVNPLGDWTGGCDVDTGAVNRKLGSDMGDSVSGGGLFGKDLSKADVSVNIYAFLKAQEAGEPVYLSCAIGDTEVDGRPYSEIVAIAAEFIDSLGGFEKFAEWGLF